MRVITIINKDFTKECSFSFEEDAFPIKIFEEAVKTMGALSEKDLRVLEVDFAKEKIIPCTLAEYREFNLKNK